MHRAMIIALVVVSSTLVASEETMLKPFVYVSGYHRTISCFVLDPATGALSPSSTSDGGPNPTYLAWNGAHTRMYAINEMGGGRVTAFTIDPRDGALQRINDASSAGKGPCHVAMHPSGAWVFTANYGSGHVGVLPLRADGGLGELVTIGLPGKHAHEVVPDATGQFLFVPCLGSDLVAQYRFDAVSGALTPNSPATVVTASGAGPRHLVMHATKPFAYLINELDSTITSFTYDAVAGTLSAPRTLSTLPAGVAGVSNSTAEVLVSPSGRFLYGSNRGHNSIVIYGIDQDDGHLTLIGHETGGGEIAEPRDFTIEPQGRFMLVASQKADLVTVFRIDPQSGGLTRVGKVTVPAGPSFVGVMEPAQPSRP